jgi:hypothetical protein
VRWFSKNNDAFRKILCGWLGKTGGAFRFSLIFSPFLIKQKGMASAAKKREEIQNEKQYENEVG